jgi:cytochrome c-type biogenesis protein CcsB
MTKTKKSSTTNSLLSFLILALFITVTILVEMKFDLSMLGQIVIKGIFISTLFFFNKFFNGKLTKHLFSMPLMSIMVFLFFLSIAIATGVETYYDTATAQKVIYKSVWFEWIIFLLFVNLISNVLKHQLHKKKEKIGSLIFHISFLIIVAGAFVTRHTGFEGMMSIPEKKSVNYILSAETYLQIKIDDLDQQYTYDLPMIVTEHTNNDFSHDVLFPGNSEPITIAYKEFLPKYTSFDTLKTVENGSKFLHIVTVGESSRNDNYLKDGEIFVDNGLKLSFNTNSESDAIQITETDSGYFVFSPYDLEYFQMSDRSKGMITRDSLQPFYPMRLYTVGGIQFVFKQTFENVELSKIESTHSPMGVDVLVVSINQGGKSQDVYLTGGKGIFPSLKQFSFNGLNYRMNFGSKIVDLPFSIYLRDFELEKYPGTDRPSSYASEVTVMEGEKNLEHRIFMNNVLDYNGYRFFQSSYNIEGEMESTVLSVNHDWWGTWITYWGYGLMMLGFFLGIFTKGSRFRFLLKKSNETRQKRENLKTIALLIGLSISGLSFGQTHDQHNTAVNDTIFVPVDLAHADEFSKLSLQNTFDNRYTPIHTFALNFLKKVSRQTTFNDLTPTQVFIGLHTNFKYWFNQPFIYVTGDSTEALIGDVQNHRARMSDFYNDKGQYKLATNMDIALSKDASLRSVFEKNIIKTDERFNIMRGVVMGYYLKIYPIKGDPSNLWYAPASDLTALTGGDSTFISGITSWYIQAVNNSTKSGNWDEANQVLQMISKYQDGAADVNVIPSKEKVKWEILYNKVDVFAKLANYYLGFGLILLILQFIQIFKPKLSLKWPMRIGVSVFFVLYIAHVLGLALRWYLSGHAPWSNGYEAIIFIGSVAILAGLIFSKQSKIVIGATGILAWLMLFVAGMNNMNPQMTDLEPVLKSYWLQIHVAIITGSYAFLGLSAILGIINLGIDIFKRASNIKLLRLTQKELTYINEMSMTIGLFMLTIGTFLGGIWANESWGRYWGWDAKETWALAAVLVYTIILHFRFIPGLKSAYTFNFWSLWGYSSILMTFFGVNYYLAGMHSYATGEAVPIPAWVPLTVLLFALLSLAAWWNKRKFI